eukprot:13666035-Alexandrium_andersonii.AAC.1
MHLAIQRDEAQPRRDQQRNNSDHSKLRHRKMNDRFMVDAENDEMFRRYCGLLGRDPRLPKGKQSKAGSVAPWNWRRFEDRPPPQ